MTATQKKTTYSVAEYLHLERRTGASLPMKDVYAKVEFLREIAITPATTALPLPGTSALLE